MYNTTNSITLNYPPSIQMSSEQKDSSASLSSSPDADAEFDTSSFPSSRREFTPAERAAQQLAQREEDDLIAAEMSRLKREQEAMAAKIQAKRVEFQRATPAANDDHMALQHDDGECLDYTRHNNRLTRVLFLEHACDVRAPLAAAYTRTFCERVIAASVAGVEVKEKIDELVVAALPADAPLPKQRYDMAKLIERSSSSSSSSSSTDSHFQFMITLDDDAHAFAKSLSTEQLSAFGQPKLIHQSFQRPTDGQSTQQVASAIKTFVQELPELLSFYA